MPLAAAERALLDERRTLTRDEALAVARLPLDDLPALIALAHRVRLAWCGPEVELESLINALARTGVQPPKTKGRILVVDDDPNALKIARVALEPLGYQTICHVSSVSGLAVVEHEPVDAVIPRSVDARDGWVRVSRAASAIFGRQGYARDRLDESRFISGRDGAACVVGTALKSRGGIDAVVKELQFHLSTRE